MSFIAVYITHENMEQAERVARRLLEKRLVACANFFPVRSTYWWKGKLEDADEVVSLLKTRLELWEPLVAEVKRLHPYEVPCIERLEVRANDDYEAWVRAQTGPEALGQSPP